MENSNEEAPSTEDVTRADRRRHLVNQMNQYVRGLVEQGERPEDVASVLIAMGQAHLVVLLGNADSDDEDRVTVLSGMMSGVRSGIHQLLEGSEQAMQAEEKDPSP